MSKPKRAKDPRERSGDDEHHHDVKRETTGDGPPERSDREAINRPVQLDEKNRRRDSPVPEDAADSS